MKTIEELRKLDLGKLKEEREATEKALFEVKFNVANGQANNTADIKKFKKQRARVKTIEKEMQKNLDKAA